MEVNRAGSLNDYILFHPESPKPQTARWVLISLAAMTVLAIACTVTYFLTIESVQNDDNAYMGLEGFALQDHVTARPVIGVFTQPASHLDAELLLDQTGVAPSNETGSPAYIAASYVKWVEAAGGRVLAIPFNSTHEQLDIYFANINGLLLTGGGADINDTLFYQSVKYMFNKAMKHNDEGGYFPIWGTCLGIELLHLLVAKDMDVLIKTDTENVSFDLHFTDDTMDSRAFGHMPQWMLQDVQKLNWTFNNHVNGMDPARYRADKKLHDFYRIVSTSTDLSGKEFITTVEGRKYPFYGTQWHPEKPPFEWSPVLKLDHSAKNLIFCNYLGNFFVSEARKNSQVVDEDLIESRMIYNFQPSYTFKWQSQFVQVYFFNSNDNGDLDTESGHINKSIEGIKLLQDLMAAEPLVEPRLKVDNGRA